MNSKNKHAGHYHIEAALKKAQWALVKTEAEKLLRLKPKDAFALKALGTAYLQQTEDKKAIEVLGKALEASPRDPEVFNNRGIAHLFLAEHELAIADFRSSLALAPKNPQTWKNYGRALLRLKQVKEAIEALAKAIEFYPGDYDDALVLLAIALSEGGLKEQARETYKTLWENGVQSGEVLSSLIFHQLSTSKWNGFGDLAVNFIRQVKKSKHLELNPFIALAIPGLDDEAQFAVSNAHVRACISRDLLAHPPALTPTQKSGRKLRIAYFSADFRKHPVGYIIPQVIELHDRSRFEVFGYSIGPDEESEIRNRLKNAFDRFIDLGEIAGENTVNQIRHDEIDILINLQGWTNDFSSELLAERAAPIQISWVGYAGTMGHACLADYLIGDHIATPIEKQAHFSEKLALVRGCYLPMDTSIGVPSNMNKLDAGLPGNCFVFCSFNNRHKFNPDVFTVWCNILAQCPDSVLWLATGGKESDDRLATFACSRGLEKGRIIFAKRTDTLQEHRSRVTAADLALDPFPYNSHSSGLDTLWAGVPMITLLGSTFAGRVGASLLTNAGLPELIATTPEEYEAMAIALYTNRQILAEKRETLASGRKTSLLWDTEKLVRDVEGIYQDAWKSLLEQTALSQKPD